MSEQIKKQIQKANKDELDKKFLLKKFLKTVFREVDFTTEQVRCLRINKKGIAKEQYSNNIDYIVEYSFRNESNWNNSYFQLCTTTGKSGKKEDLLYRYCLGFDFDKKELGENFNHKDIINRFKELKIYCHSIIDTGNGYHAYVMLNKTSDLNKVREVQKVLAERLGADLKAIKDTQVLRLPFTYNIKNDFPKTVNLVHLEEYNSNAFKAYDIDFLYQKNVVRKAEEVKDKVISANTTNHIMLNTNIPHCIADKLANGSAEGERFDDLCNIVVALRNSNKSLSQIKAICKEWAEKSNYNDNLMYRVENIYNNKKYLQLNCSNCSKSNECFSFIESDFNFNNEYPVYLLENKVLKNAKKGKGKGVMSGNEFFIYTVLKNNADGLYRSEIEQLITIKKKKKCRLSRPTLLKALEGLVDKGYLEEEYSNSKQGSFYKLSKIRCSITDTIQVSYLSTVLCILDNISTEELKFYYFLRYLQAEQIKDNAKALKGNLFQMNQKLIAEKYGVTQQQVSKLIESLLDVHLMDIWYRGKSKNNSFEYNIYRLNA